jgi:hypothetical protein
MIAMKCTPWLVALAISAAHAQNPPAPVQPTGTPPAAPEAGLGPQPVYIVQLTTGPAWDQSKSADEQPGFKEHSQNLGRMRREGLLLVGARFRDNVADKGMLILRVADAKAALAQFATDPMVRDKQFNLDVAEFQPFFEGYVARPLRSQAAPSTALKDLSWLPGCWAGSNGRMEFREHWMPAAGGMMMGMGRTLANRKVVSYESMRIETDATGVPVFTAKPSGQAEGSFKMLSGDNNRVVFENLAHDFPQRVIYELKSASVLHARIEGKDKGKDKAVDFPMRRATCD